MIDLDVPSDGHDADVGMTRGKKLEVTGIMGEDEPTTGSNGCRDHERIDSQVAARGHCTAGRSDRPGAPSGERLDPWAIYFNEAVPA